MHCWTREAVGTDAYLSEQVPDKLRDTSKSTLFIELIAVHLIAVTQL